jgi:16S rRNA (cytosine1402-N4)-methyltransferase
MLENPANIPSDSPGHVPVLPERVLDQLLDPQPGETCFDATLGRGGHAALILPRLAPGGRYVGVDLDPANIAYVSDALAGSEVRFDAVHASFTDAPRVLADLQLDRTDLLLADLGFASNQMDDPQRGFSFTHDGPLDMRLDPTGPTTAADLLNDLPQDELADLIYQFGEERLSRPISRKIVEARRIAPMTTTRQLAELCAAAYGPRGRRQKIHPATRTFMALRIAVNDELAKLDQLLEMLPRVVKPGGRVAIISFHSLEDRAVKHTFRDWAKQGLVDVLTKKPLVVGDAERAANPRSRSAKLRAIRF